MSRFLVTALGAAVLLGALSPLVLAGQPDPTRCTFDNAVTVSPKNQTVSAGNKFIFDGILRDNNNLPIQGFPRAQVELDFTGCARASTRPGDQIPADQDSDVNGRVFWDLGVTWGGADPCEARVLVQNVVFKVLPAHQGLADPGNNIRDGGVRSPDEDHVAATPGITLTDFTIFRAEFNNVNANARLDWRGDFNQDGGTTLLDLTLFKAHFNAP